MLPSSRRFVKFSYDFKFPTLPLPTSILSKLLQPSNLPSFFLPSTKDYSFFSYPKRLCEQVFSRFELKIMSGKKRAKMIRLRLFKEKEGESPLKGQWKEKKRFFFHIFPFSPLATLLKLSFFPLILRFYFTMVLGHYLRISSFFLGL